MNLHPRPSKIVCVGRNYVAHAAEMGNEVPAEPLLFLKPPSALITAGEPILLPPDVGRVDYEGEIGVVIGRRASQISEFDAWEFVEGIAPVNDVTARDLQRKDNQWSRAKGFDTFCPVGDMVPILDVDIDSLGVVSRVNGEERQRGTIDQLVFSIPFLISHVSKIMTLEPGDLLATGTPEGVGPLSSGDVVEIEIPGLGTLTNPVVARSEA
ncbi:MAG: fumarylacetoacetate hydrolase family protein [Gemmatimonadetes bacterium]|nr:fumarylacetoacetate hydrolase family protein [Gemmatimonadota bacterium]NNM06705.1 fumarylacetoacetate hydrolase family protein [Gemmatimonadota bacterium]